VSISQKRRQERCRQVLGFWRKRSGLCLTTKVLIVMRVTSGSKERIEDNDLVFRITVDSFINTSIVNIKISVMHTKSKFRTFDPPNFSMMI